MIDVLLAAAADLSIRMTVIVVAVALVLALFRVRSGGTRHTTWMAVLLVQLLMPILSKIVPPIAVSMPLPVARQIASVPMRWIASAKVTSPMPSTPQASAALSAEVTSHIADSRSVPSVPVSPFPWKAVVAAVYAAGIVFFLLRICLGLVHMSRIRRNSRALESTAGEGLFESSLVATPVTVGLFAPRVVLPRIWREWPAEMLAAVGAHERAHASRRDPLIAMFARLNCALYWVHPVAWWLERELAVTAEHACDEAAVKHVTRQRYAETLLEIAASVRRHRGRLVWHGVGVHGGGRLGRRIDRVLSATAWPELSRTRRVLLATSCALVIGAALACRQQARVEPLREDPQLAAELKQERNRQEFYKAAERMTLDEAAALERLLEQNPEDMVTREKLVVFHRWTGNNKQDWKDNIAARRRHALWLIQHHPDSELLTWVRVFKSEDPDGYVQARQLWLATIARSDVSTKVLSNAASFFEGSEKPVAEQILLRARAQEPDGPQPRVVNGVAYPSWSWRLGVLYAYAIIGRTDQDLVARWATDRLEHSTDAQVLYAAGYDLSWRPAQAEKQQFGRQLLERASRLDANIAERVRALFYQRDTMNLPPAFFANPREAWPALLEKSTGVDKLRQLTAVSEFEYMSAEYHDWLSRQPESVRRTATPGRSPEQDRQAGAGMFARSKAYSREAIDLGKSLDAATKYPDSLFRAHIAYGLHALREGNRNEAVKHLLETSSLSLPAPFDDRQPFVSSSPLEHRLVNSLLKNGERETVIEYLERGAPRRGPARREAMLKAAAAIRDGRMPEHFQRLLASGSL